MYLLKRRIRYVMHIMGITVRNHWSVLIQAIRVAKYKFK
jgi:hypothetical protein